MCMSWHSSRNHHGFCLAGMVAMAALYCHDVPTIQTRPTPTPTHYYHYCCCYYSPSRCSCSHVDEADIKPAQICLQTSGAVTSESPTAPHPKKYPRLPHSPSSPALPRAQGRIPVRNGPWCREGSGVASGFALRLHRHFRFFWVRVLALSTSAGKCFCDGGW